MAAVPLGLAVNAYMPLSYFHVGLLILKALHIVLFYVGDLASLLQHTDAACDLVCACVCVREREREKERAHVPWLNCHTIHLCVQCFS